MIVPTDVLKCIPKKQTGIINGYRWHLVFPEHVWKALQELKAPELANSWCIYIAIPYEHALFGMDITALDEEGIMGWDPELGWADYCPWNTDDKSHWFFGWDYQRSPEPLTLALAEQDIKTAIECIEEAVSLLGAKAP